MQQEQELDDAKSKIGVMQEDRPLFQHYEQIKKTHDAKRLEDIKRFDLFGLKKLIKIYSK